MTETPIEVDIVVVGSVRIDSIHDFFAFLQKSVTDAA
jgi:hypothetical protein